jgi:hypothetical protein
VGPFPSSMEANGISHIFGHEQVIDSATLLLCRQGGEWVVVIESPRIRGAVRLSYRGRDSHEARQELVARARQACPDASILSADGALESADYEWRLEIRGVEARLGDLGVALHRGLGAEPRTHRRRLEGKTTRRHCPSGHCPMPSGRPRSF